ncbi:protein ITPRID2 isoform X1 [Labrus bergylta]|uniref:protein ITPRID2 isoform X1 n=2 Tax=Labrus bergylta TaxID=56723 RepID=UPI0033132137
MESGALGVDNGTAADPRVQSDSNGACLRRRAWAQSRDSIWQESEPERCGPQEPQQDKRNAKEQRPSEGPGRVPNKITSWLIECRTPLGRSLDDQSASPNKGALRNGCSFEDDLSLGAEANHLQSSSTKTESCFGLVADQKRSQFKEKGSMNSTGSGKSSTVSSVSELLDLYEEDPEEILLNLGFGREEPDLGAKVPSRFFNSSSTARGIDIKVYLGAQMQRMEVENPNYALTSRFRQIEVLTTVANEFFQLYSQVSGQPVQRISSRDQGEGEEGGSEDKTPPPLKKTNSARNMAKLLKKTLTRHNLHAASSESAEAQTPEQQTQQNGQPASVTNTNGHAHMDPEQDGCGTDPDHQGDTINQKHNRKKDSCSLATVTEETNGDGETDDGPEQSRSGPVADKRQPENEENLTSTPEKAPPSLAPPQLAQLRNENADSFDMEEIQSNEDDALPSRTSRGSDLLRTVSQQSDSSGFAEEPSADSNSYLKVQESSDSCDSETTVTSHPSQDVATPLALDYPAFILPDGKEEGADGAAVAEVDGRNSSREEDEHDGSSEEIPQYSAHQLPKSLTGQQHDENQEEEQVQNGDQIDPESELHKESISAAEQESQPELEDVQNQPASEPQHSQNQKVTTTDTEPPTEEVGGAPLEEQAFLDDSGLIFPPPPPSPVLCALNRAKEHQLSRAGQDGSPNFGDWSQSLGRGRGRGRGFPLQRSASLPSSLLSPSKIVSSVRIQFGRGKASCTQPRYSFKYTQEDGEDKEDEAVEVEEEGQTNGQSTLIINPASSSDSKKQPARLPSETPFPPRSIPRYLMQSSYSLQSSSPPPDWSPGGQDHSWTTQSVPDLSLNGQQPGQFQQNLSSNQNQQTSNPGQTMFPYPSHNPNPTAQYLNPSTNNSPSLNPNPYPFTLNPHQQYPTPLHPYNSLPNLLHNHNQSLLHNSRFTNLQRPSTPPFPQHASLSNLHHPLASLAPHHTSLGNLHPTNPAMHHHGYNHPYTHPSPYYSSPQGSPYASSYLGYHGYNVNPHLGFPYTTPLCPPFSPEHNFHPGLAPPTPGLFPGLASNIGLHPGLAPPAPSSTEMQLRRVLHDIRGTVQSLSQNRADTPDAFIDHRAAPSSNQSLAEFQQKRRSLNVFRSQMMDLELLITRQQALVYKHLSPADRLEVEQLQSLRSAVREELQELEQQLEDRLMELTQHGGLHRDTSVESLSTASALRAMEPVSDLLREQLYLQSELSYGGHTPSPHPSSRSSRSSSPARGGGGDHEQSQGMYRASISITPVPPPRPNAHAEEEEDDELERNRGIGGGGGGGGGGGEEAQEEEGAAGGLRVENLQQLIREIRESVAKEVRREIFSELMAAVSPQRSPLPATQQQL